MCFYPNEIDTHFMSLQGTWCDALIVQAVAESHYLRIHIIESHENFGHTTIVQPVQL